MVTASTVPVDWASQAGQPVPKGFAAEFEPIIIGTGRRIVYDGECPLRDEQETLCTWPLSCADRRKETTPTGAFSLSPGPAGHFLATKA